MQKKRPIVIMIAMMLILLSACGNNNTIPDSTIESIAPSADPTISAPRSELTPATETSTYTPDVRLCFEVSFAELIDELKANALRAKRTYQDMYVELSGMLSNIDNDGKYISLSDPDDEWSFDSIVCNITDDSQLETVLMANMGDIMTVRGTITTVGEVMGYIIDIDELFLGYPTDASEEYGAETVPATFTTTNTTIDPTEFMGWYTDINDEMGALTIDWEDFLLTVSCYAYRNTWFEGVQLDTSYQGGDTIQFVAKSFYSDDYYDITLLYIPESDSQFEKDTIVLTGLFDEPITYLRDENSPRFEPYLTGTD